MHWHNTPPVRHPSGFIEPCLPTNGNAVPTGPQWVYEIKHDGFRFICRRDGDHVRARFELTIACQRRARWFAKSPSSGVR
jgi:bifunctional non-homologous end joining protein LigD